MKPENGRKNADDKGHKKGMRYVLKITLGDVDYGPEVTFKSDAQSKMDADISESMQLWKR